MKLAKKMLAFVLAFALVAALGTAMVAYADAPAVSLTQTTCELGDTVTLTLSASAFKGTQSANIEIDYDPAELTFVSSEEVDSGVAAGDAGEGLVTAAYFNLKSAEEDSVVLATYTFKANKIGVSTLTVRIEDWQQNDETVAATASNGSVTITEPDTSEKPTDPTPVDPDKDKDKDKPVEPTSGDKTPDKGKDKGGKIAPTGDAGIAIIAGVAAVAAVAFVATRKKEN